MGREAESGARRAAGAGPEQPVLMRHGAETEVYDAFMCLEAYGDVYGTRDDILLIIAASLACGTPKYSISVLHNNVVCGYIVDRVIMSGCK